MASLYLLIHLVDTHFLSKEVKNWRKTELAIVNKTDLACEQLTEHSDVRCTIFTLFLLLFAIYICLCAVSMEGH